MLGRYELISCYSDVAELKEWHGQEEANEEAEKDTELY